jgi:DNA polymerase III sliding clamp (beta) subunit (PCNA family)
MTTTIDNPKAVACAFANAALFASQDEERPVLNCVHIDANAERIRFVATDSYVLLIEELRVSTQPRLGDDEPDNAEWSALLWRDDLLLAKRALSGLKETPIGIGRHDTGVLMSFAERELLMPHSTDRDFPNWETLITGETKRVSTLGVTTWTTRRVGSLTTPSYARDEVPLRLAFNGERGACSFEVTPRDAELDVRGIFMPAQ